MWSPTRPLIAVSIAALVAVPAGASAAGGATTIGQPPIPAISCDVAGQHLTLIQDTWSAGNPSYTVPTAGVITSFTTHQNNSSARGLVLRPTGAAKQYSLVAKSTLAQTASAELVTVPARITVQPGDRIALQVLTPAGTASRCDLPSISDNNTTAIPAADFDPDTPGDIADFSAGSVEVQRQVNLSAELEPDADGDGYGDVSQDQCPTSAAQQTPCPQAPVDPPVNPPVNPPAGPGAPAGVVAAAPDTTLVGAVKKKVTKRAVTLTFGSPTAGATFRCQVDKKAATACTSPFRKSYKPGKHVVTITALAPGTGLADPTPLVVTFKVKPKKR